MYAPRLYDLEVNRETMQEFKGYNHNLRIGEGEFYNEQNLTSKYYPVLSPRARRGKIYDVVGSPSYTYINGLLAKDKLVAVKDHGVYYDNKKIFDLPYSDNNLERQLVSMGAYVIFFPDMYYLNTANLEDHGPCAGTPYSFEGATEYQLLGEDGSSISAMNMIWGEEYFPRKALYIDPLTEEAYIPFGIPENGKSYEYEDRDRKVEYTVTWSFVKGGWNDYGKDGDGNPFHLFSVDIDNTIIPNKVDTADQSAAYYDHIERMFSVLEKGDIQFGYIEITAVIDGKYPYTTVRIPIRARYNEGEKKFYRSGIEEGDRRMRHNVSQICIRTGATPLDTYNNNDCWRDENTKVRISTDSEFVNSLRENIENKDGHTITVSLSTNKNSPSSAEPLNSKYFDATNMVRDTVTIVSTTDIEVLGYIDFFPSSLKETGEIQISINPMEMKFDYIIESNNRLWACRYGENYKNEMVNEIYASARGSFSSWFKFNGTADDSYVVSLGTTGPFTGATNFLGVPVFFKENACHIIYGSYPSTYSLSTEIGTWVADGSHKSICVEEGVLYFHSRDGIYAYDGASKQLLSAALGTDKYKNAVGGCVDGKYYVSMVDAKDNPTLFVFDKRTGIWHKEDNIGLKFTAPYNGDLYVVYKDEYGSDYLYTINGTEGRLESPVEWYAESGKIGFATPDSRYIGKIQLKMMLPTESSLKLYIQYDSDGYWEYKGAIDGKSAASFPIPIMPRKCDHFSIKLAGKGECKIFSMTKTYEIGGEL